MVASCVAKSERQLLRPFCRRCPARVCPTERTGSDRPLSVRPEIPGFHTTRLQSPTTARGECGGGNRQRTVAENGAENSGTVRSLESAKRNYQTRARFTDTQPPMVEDESVLSVTNEEFLNRMKGEMRSAAIRHRRHAQLASLESDMMREIKSNMNYRFPRNRSC